MAIPNSPFSELLSSANYEKDNFTINDSNRFTVGFVSGPYVNTGGQQPSRGITGSGLYTLLELARSIQNENSPFFVKNVAIGSSTSLNLDEDIFHTLYGYTIKTPEAFIGFLNNIHNNINYIVRSYLAQPGAPGTNPGQYSYGYTIDPSIYDDTTGFYRLGAVGSYAGKNAFEFITKYYLPNAYTGNTAGVLPTFQDPLTELTVEDFKGNGITGAFVVYDSEDGQYKLSRTGMEMYVILQLLAYGCTVRLSPNYSFLSTPLNTPGNYDPKCVITLDMSTYLEGQGVTSGPNIGIFGSLVSGYASGNTYNLCHGSSGLNINGTYGDVVRRNNPINAILDRNNAQIENILVIHAGLSGYNTSLSQNTNGQPDTFSDVYRYPGFDGLTSSYQDKLGVAGLTSYRLTTSQLNDTLCIMGKKTKTITSSSFGDSNGKFTAEIPLVADVAGAFARAYRSGGYYLNAAGAGNGKRILNAESVTPTISNNANPLKNSLRQKRINFYSPDASSGIYLASDYVGSTGPVQNIYRIGVQKLANDFTVALQSYVNNFVGQINNQDTRNNIRSGIINTFFPQLTSSNPNIAQALDYATVGKRPQDSQNVVCDESNQTSTTVVTVSVIIYPKPIQTGVDGGPSNINSITVNVTVGD